MKKNRLVITFLAIVIAMLCIVELRSQDALSQSIERGKDLYEGYCITCHLPNGKGIPGTFPPLAQADFLLQNKRGSIDAIKNGMRGEVVVNGETYNTVMSPLGLSDEEVRDIMNYILNAWGNDGGSVTLKEVEAVN